MLGLFFFDLRPAAALKIDQCGRICHAGSQIPHDGSSPKRAAWNSTLADGIATPPPRRERAAHRLAACLRRRQGLTSQRKLEPPRACVFFCSPSMSRIGFDKFQFVVQPGTIWF